MRILLDTKALIWIADNDKRVSCVKDLIQNYRNDIFISTVSYWEIAIKSRIGKIDIDINKLRNDASKNDFSELPLFAKHSESFLLLPYYHKDHFDHMILAQAKCEHMTIITGDEIFKKYLPNTIVI